MLLNPVSVYSSKPEIAPVADSAPEPANFAEPAKPADAASRADVGAALTAVLPESEMYVRSASADADLRAAPLSKRWPVIEK
jgi:hypothetical protein